MKLISIELDGYRRFYPKQSLSVDWKLVALLGPNEAGKSSILKALQALNSEGPFNSEGPSRDITRGETFTPDHVVITATLLVEEADRDATKKHPEARDARWLIARKRVDGKFEYQLIPPVKRNLSPRNDIFKKLSDIVVSAENNTNALSPPPSSDLINTISQAIQSVPQLDLETLPSEALEKLMALSTQLSKSTSKSLTDLAQEVMKLVEHERKEHPATSVEKILARRLPQFIMFSEKDRGLLPQYDLNTFFGNKPTAVPAPLENLANAGDLPLKDLYRAAQTGDHGTVASLIVAANSKLQSALNSAWNQSNVSVSFYLDNNQLSILAGVRDASLEALSERSDGLRQFIALFAFLSKKRLQDKDIVLLIDEAETRLHYDAQADLVQMLVKQEFARKVIYTTHSFGCLPEDLGLGTRLIQSTDDYRRSKIINQFWSNDRPGLSPILAGMGAATMAFLPIRYCILTEGAIDMILLPSLLREAMGKEALGFQIAPGLSETSTESIAILQNEGNRVLYLVDGDDGGSSVKQKLKSAKVPNEKIISLFQLNGPIKVVEDFIDKEIYCDALNEELRRSGRPQRIAMTDFGESNRPLSVRNWCTQNAVGEPNKTSVAYRVLEYASEKNIVDPAHRKTLVELYGKIRKAFSFKDAMPVV